jgi:septum site-determining protein MinC
VPPAGPETPSPGAARPPVASTAAAPATLYHRGTLRGGRALQQLGSIVVVGDVNPGAELVATGDIVVFGALRGTAHAGAQGDEQARVFALELAPTQLRIATFIATGEDGQRKLAPEVAFVSAGRIAIGPYPQVEVKR